MTGLRILLFLTSVLASMGQVINLSQYNISTDTVTVSGISSGAAFATQYHVIYSSEVLGMASFAGIVYRCADGVLGTALTCMTTPSFTNAQQHVTEAKTSASNNEIDDTIGMAQDKVFLFQGNKDTVVHDGNGPKMEIFYQAFAAEILTEFTLAAEHCQPTDFYGPACNHKGGEYINNCEYNGAYEALNFMLGGGLVQPDNENTSLPGVLSQFDQDEFFDGNAQAVSLDSVGYIYVPSGCADKSVECHLHVVFHGCEQGRDFLDDVFVTETGYQQVGELNNIIMLFPQAVKKTLDNPNGCWDWWGYTGGGLYAYAKNFGVQPVGIRKMVQTLVYGEAS